MSMTAETKQSSGATSSGVNRPPVGENFYEKWGTRYMGAPAEPSSHPQNQQAATWGSFNQRPYQIYSNPVPKPSQNPMEFVLHKFNSWSKKTETLGANVWHNLKTGHSVSDTAWGKLKMTAKAMTEGGFEALYKQTFVIHSSEKLKKTFACYLSTSTGPVAGTLYLSNYNLAFCSDMPLSFLAPSGQETWCHYKVMIPLVKISAVNPIIMKDNPKENYIQIVTVDGHDFWFMGFVNYDKASLHISQDLQDSVCDRLLMDKSWLGHERDFQSSSEFRHDFTLMNFLCVRALAQIFGNHGRNPPFSDVLRLPDL